MRSVDNSRGSGDKSKGVPVTNPSEFGDKSRRVPATNVGLLEQLLVAQWGAKVKARMKIENTFYGYVITKHLLL